MLQDIGAGMNGGGFVLKGGDEGFFLTDSRSLPLDTI